MKKSLIAKIVSIILIIILICGVVGVFALPTFYDLFKSNDINKFNSHNLIYRLAFYACYIICLIIVLELIKLFNCIYKESPFNKIIVNKLGISSILFMILFVIVVIKCIFIPTLLSFAVALLSFLISLSFYVLKEVMKSAIYYKKELDDVI